MRSLCVCVDRIVLLLKSIHVIKIHKTRERDKETEKPSEIQSQINSVVELIYCVNVNFLVLIMCYGYVRCYRGAPAG